MAKKVFRIHSEGATNIDWFVSTEINSNLIDSIHTDGGDGKKLPTSIPSPFARIDLVRTAFKTVAERGDLDGLERNGRATATDNHKLISDALDIGQILFNYNKHKDDLQLVSWDRKSSLDKLLNGNSAQKHLGKTLELFLNQDSSQYNFDKFNKIYILKYKHKIIGGTSPRTLFFAAPNAEKVNIKFGQDIMLDEQLHPLYKRDKEYVKYLHALSKSTNNFNQNFPEVNAYIVATLNELQNFNESFHSELMSMNCDEYLMQLTNVVFNNNAGEPLEIISGIPQKQFIKDPAIIQNQSDFVIKTTKNIEGLKPLILPVDPLSLNYIYTEDNWNVKTKVPVEDKRQLNERTLPDQGDMYPYLTMNDFLADSIIKLPYEVNSEKFLTVGSKKFLLPIKEGFFKYFSVDDIRDKDLIKTTDLAGDSVEVMLSIPIKKGFITYKKIYYPIKSSVSQSNDSKKGTIIEKPVALSVYPFVVSAEKDITYSVGIADVQPNKNEKLEVSFYNAEKIGKLNVRHQTQRAAKPFITQHSIIEEGFDVIALNVGNVENIIIPKWKGYQGNTGDNYHFAIDLGTTNSHIEYKIEGQGSERAYDIKESDEQIAFLMPEDVDKTDLDIDDILEAEGFITQEVLSKRFGKDELRNTPFRTCLIQNVDVNYTKPTKVFADANIAFDYEKLTLRPYLNSYTDLKWAIGSGDDKSRLELYIEEMLMLCKNKVLMNNGNLSNTIITWFYPVSMTTNHLLRLRKIWQDKFEKVFNINEDNLVDYPESIAPFYYYKAKGGIKAHARPSVSIDIGGGTSDVMIFADGEPQLITSFKFAGNAIFGDGFNGNIATNGFVQKYYPKIKDILIQNNLKAEVGILDKIYEDNASSADLVNFFFSLKDNKGIKDQQLDLSFSKMLEEDSEFKVLFLIFYAAIVYHIAEMMKIKGMDTPRNILFSGTGSKTLSIIDSNKELASLTQLFEEIFNEVYSTNDSRIKVKTDKNPKELTCKGGFHIDDRIDIKRHTELVEVSLGNIKDKQVQKRNDISDDAIKYQDVNDVFRTGVIDNVEEFYKVFSTLNKKMNFNDEFGISQASLKVFEEMKSYDLEDCVMEGLDRVKADSNDDEPLSETLFFYPLVGKLNELATEIHEKE
jgi:hypothetical protein